MYKVLQWLFHLLKEEEKGKFPIAKLLYPSVQMDFTADLSLFM